MYQEDYFSCLQLNMASAQQTGTFIISALFLVLSIVSVIGLYWLTSFAFTAKSSDGDKTYTISGFSKTKIHLARLTVVLIWLQICLAIISVLWTAAHFT